MPSAMVTRRRLLEAAGAAGTLGALGSQTTGAQSRDPLDRYIVGTDPGRADVARQRANEVHRELDFEDVGQAVSGWYPEEAIQGLRNNPHVRYVEPEGEVRALDHTGGGDPSEEQVLPWGIDRVDADAAHHDGETGGGSSIAIIDTGIDPDHETLEVSGGEAFVSCRGSCATAWDDDNGHGTHCAGTADAVDNAVGVVGVSTAADLYAVKVLDSNGSGTYSDIAAGIEWTADQGIDVGSLSLGGGDSQTMQDACQYAQQEGPLLVAAAGNDGPDGDTVSYPAAYEECIAVSATTENDDIASFSSRGPEVELAAPGADILSSLPGDDYASYDGTSMACPHVAGAGAQLMEHDYTNDEARDRLAATAEDLGLDDTEQGNGLLDVAAALDVGGSSSLAVATGDATGVGTDAATLNGDLTDLGGADAADCYFEYRQVGADAWTATAAQTLSSTGSFSEDVTGLQSGTDYEFRAVAETADDADTGSTATFTTDGTGSAPAIDAFDLTDTSNPRWARVEVDWSVSDPDGDLDRVRSVLGDGADSESSSVAGSSAAGSHELRERDGHGQRDVTLIVTDASGAETSETKTITLG